MRCNIRHAAGACALILIDCVAVSAASPTLEVRGRVELPGGGPAAGARLLVVHNNLNLARHELQADADGQFAFVNPFHEQTVIIARSSDEKLQRRVSIAETQVRAMSPERLRIDLRPARQVRVRVTRDDQAVGDVRVAVDGAAAIATTNSSGEVQLLVPDPIERTRISAWHAQLGIGGAVLNPASQEQAELQIDLT